MQNIRNVIRDILLEDRKPAILDTSVDEITSLIRNASSQTQVYGYNVLDVVLEQDSTADLVFTISLQHIKPDFGKYIDELVARGGKFSTIYGDTPASKTKITRWLTGYKEGSEIDARQKSAAIKVAQLAGLDCINSVIIEEIEKDYNCTCVANFTGAKTNKKGQSFFELFIFDTGATDGGMSTVVDPLPEPTQVVVDGETVTVPTEPKPVSPTSPTKKKKKKSRKTKKQKMPKLTGPQKKKGYNRINQQGHIRHVHTDEELDTLEDHIVATILGTSQGPQETYEPSDAHDLYKLVRESEGKLNTASGTKVFRVVDDYYNDALPILKFYEASVYKGKIKSRSMMSQYTSVNSNQKEGTVVQHSTGKWVKGMVNDPNYGRSFADEDFGEYTHPKLGGKEAKDARRMVAKERASDEVIIYAKIEPKINKFSGKISKHTGEVTLYVFLIDRNFA